MAPKRSKPQVTFDLTGDEDDDDHNDYLNEPSIKRRRSVVKRQKTTAETEVTEGGLHNGSDGGGAGPSSAGPSARRAKRKINAKEDAPEKERRVDEMGRTVVYRPMASQDVRARIMRAMPGSAHRMFLVDSRQLSPVGSHGGPSQEFHVLGATGNVYTVRISRNPHCSCPDFGKGHLCKHILFVMLRVLRQSPENPVIWQRALLTHEVEEVLGPLAATGNGAGTVDQSVLATERVRQRYAAITSGAAAQGEPGSTGGVVGVQRPVEGECPICYENLVASGRGPAEAITFCTSCGNNMHKDCFDRWATSKRSSGQTVTCVYCRAPWKTTAGAAAGESPGGSEYINLSQYSDAHRNAPSLEDLYGSNAYFILANNGEIGRRQAVRLHAAARGWA